MSFLQGGALPNVTETTTSTTSPTSTEYGTLLKDIAGAGSTAIGREGKDSVAGYDPMQTLGYNALPGAVNAYRPGLDAAQQTASRAAAGITPGRIQSLMNPYTTNVVNEMARLTNQNMERNLLPGLKAGFVGTGGLGSQRYAGALGQSLADMQANLTGQQTGALSAGYGQALKGALDEAQLMNATAKTQADIAKQEQDLGILGAGALTKAGAERQKYEQSLLDAPLSMAKEASGLMRGLAIPVDQTNTFSGPKTRDYYQQSDLGKMAGVLSLIGGAREGKESEGLSRLLGILQNTGTKGGSIINSLLYPSGAATASVGQGEIDALMAAGVYDDYQALISGLQNNYLDMPPEDVSTAYTNLLDVLGEDDYFTGI
jgi:hypothetical protein